MAELTNGGVFIKDGKRYAMEKNERVSSTWYL